MLVREPVTLTSTEQCNAFVRTRSLVSSWLPWLAPVCVEINPDEAEIPELPTALVQLGLGLQSLTVRGSSMPILPESISRLVALRKLQVSKGQLSHIPPSISLLQGLDDLDLSNNHLEEIPASLGSLTRLKYLNLMGNSLVSLPDSLCNLHSLYRLGLKDNKFTHLPDSFGGLTSLVELFLTSNRLTALPDGFGQLSSLVKLQASFNCLQALPSSITRLQKLELMRVAINDIQQVPDSLSEMHGLAWLSIAGNPACAPACAPLDLPTLAMSQLEVGRALGDGASGDVFEARYLDRPVAVKVFRADVSPDGRAQDEIAVASCLDHPNLIRVRGRILQPPALVVDRIEGTPLAAKPNHASLLRCRWAEDAVFAPARAACILLSIARALAYLHERNICHGDIYGHNVIADNHGHAVLYDYGASFFYPPGAGHYEAQEVRAYGLLLQDVAARLEPASHTGEVHSCLVALVNACVHAASKDRPRFDIIVMRLEQVQAQSGLQVSS